MTALVLIIKSRQNSLNFLSIRPEIAYKNPNNTAKLYCYLCFCGWFLEITRIISSVFIFSMISDKKLRVKNETDGIISLYLNILF